jgi:DSF synthase
MNPPARLALRPAIQLPELPVAPQLLDTPDLHACYEPEERAVWLYAHPRGGRPCFTPALLSDIVAQQDAVSRASHTTDFFLNCSDVPGVYSLGGDLHLFRALAAAGDEGGLLNYARACIDAVYNNAAGLHADVVTLAVVRGEALGGGLEAALSCQVVIAEKGAKMGFPEVLFNLFPGMGAYSLVARKANAHVADILIGSGQLQTAEALFEMGLVDHLAEPGQGEHVAREVMRGMRPKLKGLRAYYRAKDRAYDRLDKEELLEVAYEWVEAALRLDTRDLKMMDRLVRAQNKAHG